MGRGDGWGCGQRGDSPSGQGPGDRGPMGPTPVSYSSPSAPGPQGETPLTGKEKQRTGWVRRVGEGSKGRGQKPDGTRLAGGGKNGFNGMKGSQTELSPSPDSQAPLKGFAFDPGPSSVQPPLEQGNWHPAQNRVLKCPLLSCLVSACLCPTPSRAGAGSLGETDRGCFCVRSFRSRNQSPQPGSLDHPGPGPSGEAPAL